MTSQKVNDVMISYPSYEKPGSQKAKIHIFKKSISRKLLDENEKFFFWMRGIILLNACNVLKTCSTVLTIF